MRYIYMYKIYVPARSSTYLNLCPCGIMHSNLAKARPNIRKTAGTWETWLTNFEAHKRFRKPELPFSSKTPPSNRSQCPLGAFTRCVARLMHLGPQNVKDCACPTWSQPLPPQSSFADIPTNSISLKVTGFFSLLSGKAKNGCMCDEHGGAAHLCQTAKVWSSICFPLWWLSTVSWGHRPKNSIEWAYVGYLQSWNCIWLNGFTVRKATRIQLKWLGFSQCGKQSAFNWNDWASVSAESATWIQLTVGLCVKYGLSRLFSTEWASMRTRTAQLYWIELTSVQKVRLVVNWLAFTAQNSQIWIATWQWMKLKGPWLMMRKEEFCFVWMKPSAVSAT